MSVVLPTPGTPPMNGASHGSPRLFPSLGKGLGPIARLPKRARENTPPAASAATSQATPAPAPLAPLNVVDASPPASPNLRRLVHLRLTDYPIKASSTGSKISDGYFEHQPGDTGTPDRRIGGVNDPGNENAFFLPSPATEHQRSRSTTPDGSHDVSRTKRQRRESISSVASEEDSDDDAASKRMTLPLPPHFRIKPSPLHTSFSAARSPPSSAAERRVLRSNTMLGSVVTGAQSQGEGITTRRATTVSPTQSRQGAQGGLLTAASALGAQSSPCLPKARARLQQLNLEASPAEQAGTEIEKVFALGYGKGLGAKTGGCGMMTRRQSALWQSQAQEELEGGAGSEALRSGGRRFAKMDKGQGIDSMEVDQ